MSRVFILSPASCGGRRAQILFNDAARFDLAREVRTPTGAPLGEVFSFLSGLYFRGKLAYAREFANPPRGCDGVQVITPSRGLLNPDLHVTIDVLHEFAGVPIDLDEPRYFDPFESDAQKLAKRVGDSCEVVLLGSVATDKYVAILSHAFGERLRFPAEFVGRGDMSRGGLLLRCIDDARELTYVPVEGAIRHGARPPRLEKRSPR
ncbi:MAG: hypothetical protein WEE89_20815 [Gemmatimonadota bacterium]